MAKQVDRPYMQKFAKTTVGKGRLSVEDIRGLTKGMQQQGPYGEGFGQIQQGAYGIDTTGAQQTASRLVGMGNTLANRGLVGGRYNPIDQGSYAAQQQAMQGLLQQGQGNPQMQQYANALASRFNQESPSAAQAQFQQNLDQSIKAQQAMAASARGVSPALAARMAQQGAEGVMQGAAAQAAQLRAQEAQAQRAQQLSEMQAAAGITGQNIGLGQAALGQAAGIGAGVQQQALAQQLGFAGTQIQQQQAAAAMQQAGGAMGVQAATMEAAARQAEEQARQQYYNRILAQYGNLANYGLGQSGAQWSAAPSGIGGELLKAGMGGLAQGGGQYLASQAMTGGTTAAATSDVRAKKNIDEEQGEEDLQEFLDALKPAKYEYKDKADGEGPQYSVMAQDLEKSDVGKVMVEKRPDGMRQVNYAKGLAAMLSAQAFINKRLKKLEKKAA